MAKSTRSKSTSQPSMDEVMSTLSTMDAKLNLVLCQMTDITKRLDKIEEKQSEYGKTFEHLTSEIDTLKNKINNTTSTVTDMKVSEGYENLVKRIEATEHASRAKCIELNGIPHGENENLMEGLGKLIRASEIGNISLTTDIDNIYRVRKTNRVVVKFIQANKRDNFFLNYRKNIKDTSVLGFKQKTKIYINEVLSKDQSALFWKARNFKKDHDFRFIWTFNQCIYMRKTNDSDAIKIKTEQDLDDLAII